MGDKWHNRFLQVAGLISTWSRDPSTQVGAVAVRDRQILATGYNGIPRGVVDLPERMDRPAKYLWTEHAERNVVAQAARVGVSLVGATVYVASSPSTLFVCADCARSLIQAGVTEIVCRGSEDVGRWADSCLVAREMFREAGVTVTELPAPP